MAGLHRQDRQPFDLDATPIAVGICRTHRGRSHAGILCPDEKDRAVVLHLAWHHVLQQDDLDADLWSKAVWAAPNWESETAEALAAVCRLVWENHKDRGLPYAFRYVDGTFNVATGQLVLGNDGVGFTCSTFVLGVLKARRVNLLRQEEWQVREGDVENQQDAVRLLRSNGARATQAHIERVESEIGCVRFRPSDVVAGAAGNELPVGFDDAVAVGTQAENLLDQ